MSKNGYNIQEENEMMNIEFDSDFGEFGDYFWDDVIYKRKLLLILIKQYLTIWKEYGEFLGSKGSDSSFAWIILISAKYFLQKSHKEYQSLLSYRDKHDFEIEKIVDSILNKNFSIKNDILFNYLRKVLAIIS